MKPRLQLLIVLALLFPVPAYAQEAASTGGAEAAADKTGIISIDFKDAELQQVLRVISLKSGVDIVAGPDVTGLVTIKLTNVHWEQALKIILRTYGYTYERSDSIVRVMTIEALEQEALTTEVFPLDYADASQVPDIIADMLSDRGRVRFDARTNTVIVTDIPTTLFQIKEVIARLDARTPQVRIAAKIVETRLERNENLGIDWNDSVSLSTTATTLETSFPFVVDGTLGSVGEMFVATPIPSPDTITLGTLTGPAFSATLNMLKTRTDTKIVSNPTLAVLDNQEARIHIGEDYPVPTFSLDATTGLTTVSGFETKVIGTVLTVTPQVNPNKEIVVKLRPEVIAFTSNATFSIGTANAVSLPRFSTQTVDTMVRVSNGDTIAIGGLVKDTEVLEETGIPFLSDIPLIGLLFKSSHRHGGGSSPTLKQDLLVFITVDLLDDDVESGKTAVVAQAPAAAPAAPAAAPQQ